MYQAIIDRWQSLLVIFLILLVATIILLCAFLPSNKHCETNNVNMSLIARNNTTIPNNLLTNPLIVSFQNSSQFGQFMFVHDKGFIAVSAAGQGFSPTRILLYQVSNDTVNKLQTEFNLVPLLNPAVESHLVSGCFMPSLGLLDEVYYLILVLGLVDADQNKYGRELHFYYYDTNASNHNSNTWTKSNLVLQHPYYGTDLNPRNSSKLWVGCFGNSIQGLVDFNITGGVRQSLYIGGTQYEDLSQSRPQPSSGGMVFQYLFLTNDTTPSLSLQSTIQDAKLKIISEDSSTPAPISPFGLTPDEVDFYYYMQGFGSVFYATSNILAVSNLTNQDTVSNPCDSIGNASASPGYVQVFIQRNGLWTQEYAVCDSTSKQIYVNRLTGPLNSVGFGAGLYITSNFLFVNCKNNLTFTYFLNLDVLNPLPNPIDQPAWSQVNTTSLSSETNFPGPIYNRSMLMLDGNLIIASYSQNPNEATIGIFSTSNSTNVVSVTPGTSNLFKSFGLLQTLGNGVNSGSSTSSLLGFGQWIQICTTPNQLRKFLFINDPLGKRILGYETTL